MLTRHRFFRPGIAALALLAFAMPAMAQRGLAPKKPHKPATDPNAPDPNAPNGDMPAPPLGPDGKPLALIDQLFTRSHERDWIMTVDIHLTKSLQQTAQGAQSGPPIDFQTAAFVFPLPASTAMSLTSPPDQLDKLPAGFSAVLTFDDQAVPAEPKIQGGYDAGTRLVRLETTNQHADNVRFTITIPITTWQTDFNDDVASKIPWPKGAWDADAASALKPEQGVEYLVKLDEQKELTPITERLLKSWLEGKDPKSMKPVALAKLLCGRVIEIVQPSGDGMSFTKGSVAGGMEGFDLQGAARTLDRGRGSEHDLACALVAIYRAAGLPARTVIGYDLTQSKGSKNPFNKTHNHDKFRTWAEFAVVDPATGKDIWIPVDILRQRQTSSRLPSLDEPWKYFGANDEGDYLLPIAYQFSPPTTVFYQGSPAFWGWLTTPSTQSCVQFLSVTASNPTQRGNEPTKKRKGL